MSQEFKPNGDGEDRIDQQADELAASTCSAYVHKHLGNVEITEVCRMMQRLNPDPSSIFVSHDGEIKEVTRNLLKQNAHDDSSAVAD